MMFPIYDVPCTFVTKKKTKPLEALDTIVHTFALSAQPTHVVVSFLELKV
jgi:hypothetical protein